MRKLYALLVVCLLCVVQATFAQTNIASYKFSSSIGTYTPITGTAFRTATWDSEVSTAISLGGTFTFGGVDFTTVYITANGWIGFKTGSAVSSTSTPLSGTAGTALGVISAYANDGGASTAPGATPVISYANVGDEFVVQYQDHANWSNRPTERLNFQIRLNLLTDQVNIVYGSFTAGSPTSTSSEVGIRGNSTTWTTNVNNLMLANIPAGTTCNWTNAVTGNTNSSKMLYSATNTNITVPNGLTYTWSPGTTGLLPVRTFTAVTGITASGANIHWRPATGATSYNVQYRTPASCTWTNHPVAVNDTTVTLTGLNAATAYQVRIQAVNASDTAIWSHIPNSAGTGDGYTTSGTFITSCVTLNTPTASAETFASYPPICWSEAAGLLGSPTTFSSTTTSNWTNDDFGNNVSKGMSARLEIWTTTTDEWLISPSYDLGAGGNKQMEFDLAFTTFSGTTASTLGSDDKFVVLISTDDGATWTSANTLREWNSGTPISNTGEHIIIDLSAYTGVVKFAFYGESTVSGGDNNVYVDNFEIKIIPACAKPLNVNASAITASGATIGWDASTSNPASYDVYYNSTNSAPDAGTAPTVTGVSGITTDISGLSPQTTYYVWVRANCGAGGTSEWSAAPGFKTACTVISAPYSESFSTGVLPNCWTNTSSNPTAPTGVWKFTGAGGYTAITTRTAGTYAWADGSDPSNIADVTLMTPMINLTGLTDPQLAFDVHSFNENTYANNTLTVDVNDGTGWANVYIDNTSIKEWRAIYVSLAAYIGKTVQVRFVFDKSAATSGNAFYHDILLDEVMIRQAPACMQPTGVDATNVTNTAATISWSASLTPGASYQVYHHTSATAPNGSTTPTVDNIATLTTDLSGLTAQTKYFVWVRSNCGAAGFSEWSVVDSFTTACAPVTAFNENFDGVTTPNLPACWGKILRGATISASASVGTSTTNYTAPNSVAMSNSGSGAMDDIILVSPIVSNLSAGTHRLRFHARNATASQDLEIGTLNGSTSSATFTVLQPVDITTTFAEYIVDFSGYSGTDQYIGIRRLSTSTFTTVYIDNIAWEAIPSCLPPTDLQVSNVTTTSASLMWSPPAGTAVGYEIFYSNSTTPPVDSTVATVTGVAATQADLTGLTPGSVYYVWVRTNCGADTSLWSARATITTLCAAISAPTATAEGFATYLPSICWREATGSPTGTPTGTSSSWIQDDFADVVANGKAARLNVYGTSAKEWLISPAYDLGTGGNLQLEFNMALTLYNDPSPATFDSDDKFIVLISSDDGSTWTPLREWNSTTAGISHTGERVNIPLQSYNGLVKFAFYGESTSSTADNNLHIDSVSVGIIPDCVSPTDAQVTGITTSDAVLNWTASISSPAFYEVHYSTSGVAPTASTAATVDSIVGTSLNLAGLTPATNYYAWVRSVCSASDTSAWLAFAPFATLCDVVNTFPYTQSFDATTIPPCYAQEMVSGSATWKFVTTNGNSTVSPRSGTHMAEFRTTTAGNKAKLVLPVMDLTTLSNPEISFFMANVNWAGDIDELRLYYKTSAGGSWTQFGSDYTTENTTWTEVRLALPNPSSTYYIAFEGTSQWARGLNIDDVRIGEAAPMPVTLTNFAGQRAGATNMLTWSTATESNNSGFELERSADGRNFSSLTFVASKADRGNSNLVLNYTFTDEKPLIAGNYYRLKQVDKDGKMVYSSVVYLKGDKVDLVQVSGVYPNPAVSVLNVLLSAPANDRVVLVVTDLTGKAVRKQEVQLKQGENQVQVQVAGLASGTYIIKAVCANGCETAINKFIKQ